MPAQNDDLNKKISQIMSDPESMKQIQQLGTLLGLNTDTPSSKDKPPEEEKEPIAQNSGNSTFDPQMLNSLLGGSSVSPEMMGTIMKIIPLISSINNKDDKNTRLLEALRPFLSENRKKKLDESSKLLSLFSILPILKNSGLF